MNSENWRALHIRVGAEEKEGIFFLKKQCFDRRNAGMFTSLSCLPYMSDTRQARQEISAGAVLQQLCSAYQGNQVKYLRDYFLEVMDTCSDS